MIHSSVSYLSDRVQRIECCGLHVDIIATSKGTVRVGSMPDIAKFLREHDCRDDIVVVPDWEISPSGDNRTGEEFILWHAQAQGGIPRKYVGLSHNVGELKKNLERIFPYYFDETGLSIVKKKWLKRWFHRYTAEPCYRDGPLEVLCQGGNIQIRDE